MKYEKPPTTIEQQVERLKERGMSCNDIDLVHRWLTTVGYYRLSSYWIQMEASPNNCDTRSKRFRDGSKFEDVVDIYIFDRKLRLLTMEAIERIEIAVRSRWTNLFTLEYGPHGYLNNENFTCGMDHPIIVAKIANQVADSSEIFVQHYKQKYTSPVMPPLWVVTETMTLGQLSKWFAVTSKNSLKSNVARDLGLPTRELLESILQVLALVRNICAHHGRLWNRKTVKKLPNFKRIKNDMEFEFNSETNQSQPQNYIYNVLVVIVYLMRSQSEETTFPCRLFNLLIEISDENLSSMGFPDDWKGRDIWNV